MRTAPKVALLGSVCGLLLAAAPAAHADHHYYHHGKCSFSAVGDGSNGPGTRWDGEVHLAVVAADEWTWAPTGEQLTVECVLYVGSGDGTVVLSESGTGAVAKAAQLTFYADPDDVVTFCTRVTTDDDVVLACGGGPPRPLLPPAIWEPMWGTIDAAAALAGSAVCLALVTLDGGPADEPPAFDIRSDGDLYVAGEWFWDCPPTGGSGS